MSGTISATGYEQVTTLNVAAGLASIPNRTNYVLIDVEDQNVRVRADGTDPTATVGAVMKAGAQYEFYGNVGNLRFIEEAASAKLNVQYFYRVGA